MADYYMAGTTCPYMILLMESEMNIDLKAEPSNNRLVHGPVGLSMIF
jgi:hypothetical protein